MEWTATRYRSLAVGAAGALVALFYGVQTELVGLGADGTVSPETVLVTLTLVVLPFGIATGATYVALRHHVYSPLALVAVGSLLPLPYDWYGDEFFVAVLVVGPLVLVAGLAEALVRYRFDRLRAAPGAETVDAVVLGTVAATLYAVVVTVRAALPLSHPGTGAPAMLPASINPLLAAGYALGISLLLVGVPIALWRLRGLVAPLVAMGGYVVVDLLFVQPWLADGPELAVLVLWGWPMLVWGLVVLGGIECRLRGDVEPLATALASD